MVEGSPSVAPEGGPAGGGGGSGGPPVLHQRFVLGEALGRGSFGVVHAAEDLRFEREVAVKLLHHADPDAAFRLKREFRVLRDLRHPNLVQLYELFTDRPPYLFSMERVMGGNLATAREAGPPSPAWVIGILRQLADGLGWLHRAGVVHGDVKPSNALLNRDGRLVLCDFGLGGRLLPGEAAPGAAAPGGGTDAYRPPEQLAGDAPGSVAGDWYAVGALLFEMLTGTRPFPGTYGEMCAAKDAGTVVFPPDLSAPAALVDLVRALLHPDPARRAGEAEVRALTGPSDRVVAPPSPRVRLIGRGPERAVLHAALDRVRQGRCEVVELRGPSGMGKSALLDAFADEVAGPGGGVVLAGACHVREHLPLNVFDGLVDALARHMATAPELWWPRLNTPDATSLVTLFPALGRVTGPLSRDEIRSGGERRRRGVDALRALLGRVASHQPTVLLVDDMQWADADSLALLRLLLAPPAAPPVLLVLGVRSDLVSGSLRGELLPDDASEHWPHWTDLSLGPLPPEDTRALVAQVAGDGSHQDLAVAESGGHPFLAMELARHQGALREGRIDLAGVIRHRVAALPRLERRLVEVCAVAGHPLPPRVALEAAGVGVAEFPVLLSLQAARLLRSSGDAAEPLVDTYHDVIRREVAGGLTAEVARELHLHVADAGLAEGLLDASFLTRHLQEAGDRRAGAYAAAAATRAMEALAFAAAAQYYGLAADLGFTGAPTWVLRRDQAAALALAGKGVAAAEAYEAAAAFPEAGDEALTLRREAAEQWLRVGKVERGLARLRAVLDTLSLGWPQSLLGALWTILSNRVRLRLGGVRWVERAEGEADAALLARTDATWSATVGLNMLDLMRSAAFQAQHTRLALRAGEPGRVARALSVEGVYIACEGGPGNRAFAEGLFEKAHAIADRTGLSAAGAFAHITHGAAELFVGRPARVFPQLDAAETALRGRQVGAVWEVLNCQMYRSWAWWWQGDFARMVEVVPGMALDARSRGDVLAEVCLASGLPNFTWLVLDDLADARARTDHAVSHFPEASYGSPHYFHLVASVNAALYAGGGEAAWREVVAAWPRLRRILLLNMQYFRIDLTVLRARAALAAGPVGAADAARQIRALARENHPFGAPLAAVLGARDPAALRAALPALDAVGVGGFAAAARHLLGEESGWAAQGVVQPDRLAATLLPRPPG